MLRFVLRSGAGDRTRTYDPIITNDVLYQLSYTGALAAISIVPITGKDLKRFGCLLRATK